MPDATIEPTSLSLMRRRPEVLIKNLRRMGGNGYRLADEAADEIERLRAALKAIVEADADGVFGDVCWGEREAAVLRQAKEALQ